jgi:hypothetical protein
MQYWGLNQIEREREREREREERDSRQLEDDDS